MKKPLHLNSASSKHNYRKRYNRFFGGVSSIKPKYFEFVNGFSNIFYGWGGEDTDFSKRMINKGIMFEQNNFEWGRYEQ